MSAQDTTATRETARIIFAANLRDGEVALLQLKEQKFITIASYRC